MTWFKSKPIFSDSIGTGRAITKLNKPLFSYGHGITKKPSDVNDVSNSKDTYERKESKIIITEEERRKHTKNTKEIKSKTGNIDENKWMFTMMRRARQI